jgi:hypothetical protein
MMRKRASEVASLKYNDSVGTGECGRCMISNVDEYKDRAYAAQGLRVVWLSDVGLARLTSVLGAEPWKEYVPWYSPGPMISRMSLYLVGHFSQRGTACLGTHAWKRPVKVMKEKQLENP